MTERNAPRSRASTLRLASLVMIAFGAIGLMPVTANAVVNMVWSCPTATAGANVANCPGGGTWSWQVAANGVWVVH